MPYSAQHKERSRQRILASAYKLFSTRGFDNVSISEIMADAQMTHGGFYAHFANKSKLYRDAIRYAANKSRFCHPKPDALDGRAWIRRLLREYLHIDNTGTDCQCPLASLATDVVVRDPEVRQAYTATFKGMNRLIAQYNNTYSDCDDDTILATTAMVIGGLAIARALDDAELVRRLLENCRQQALRLLAGTEPALDAGDA